MNVLNMLHHFVNKFAVIMSKENPFIAIVVIDIDLQITTQTAKPFFLLMKLLRWDLFYSNKRQHN